MSSQNHRGAVRSVRRVDCAHLCLQCDPVSKDLARDLDSEHLLVLCGFFSASVEESSAIGGVSVVNRTDFFGHVPDALVRARKHHFVHYDLLSSEDDTVFANNSEDSAIEKRLEKFRVGGVVFADNQLKIRNGKCILANQVPLFTQFYPFVHDLSFLNLLNSVLTWTAQLLSQRIQLRTIFPQE